MPQQLQPGASLESSGREAISFSRSSGPFAIGKHGKSHGDSNNLPPEVDAADTHFSHEAVVASGQHKRQYLWQVVDGVCDRFFLRGHENQSNLIPYCRHCHRRTLLLLVILPLLFQAGCSESMRGLRCTPRSVSRLNINTPALIFSWRCNLTALKWMMCKK